ncbi:hypothetical protein DFH09DRAFT_1361088 [Mycena vulgaris]|nr:hypothetical protein DFH09DRAFT_1361088 [Mycena vulgaris]
MALYLPPTIQDVYRCLQFLTRSIEDAKEPKHCATCLLGCCLSVDNFTIGGKPRKETPAEAALLNPLRASFCRATISFVTIPRTSQELSAVMAHLSECTCADASVPLIMLFHELGREALTERWAARAPSAVFIAYLFDLLRARISKASSDRVAKGRGNCWPESVDDIVPFGPAAFVTAMGQWIIVLDEPALPLQVFAPALPICGRPLFIALTASPVFMRQLIISMKAINRHIQDDRRGRPVDGDNPWTGFRDFLHAVMSTRTSQNSIMFWAQGHETQLWTIFSETIQLLRSPALNLIPVTSKDVDAIVTTFCNLVVQFSPNAVQPRRIHRALAITSVPVVAPPNTKRGLLDLIVFIADLKRQRYCFVVGCPWSFQEIGNSFRKCGGCAIPGYCSAKCQQQDWKDPQFPHRTFCKTIKGFVNAGGGKLNDLRKTAEVQKFANQFNFAAFPRGDTTLEDIAAWAWARRDKVEEWDLKRAQDAMLTGGSSA